jgi:hypothetical protein
MNRLKRRIEISAFCGIGITLTLAALSVLAVRFMPYKDKPMMPKPFFLYLLSPGIILAESVPANGWVNHAAFFIGNSLAYAIGAYCLLAAFRAMRREKSV